MFDVAVVVFYIGMFGAAFLLGSVRATIMLLSLIAGLVGASVFTYPLLEMLLDRIQGVDLVAGRLMAFIIAWLAVAISIGYVLNRTYDVASGRGHLRRASIGGISSIVLLAIISFVVATVTTVVMVQVIDSTAPEFSMRLWRQVDGSVTAQAVLELSPHVYRLVDALTPGPATELLRPRNG